LKAKICVDSWVGRREFPCEIMGETKTIARSSRQEDEVGEVTITNCVSTDTTWAVREIAATQRLNARANSDRTYSFARVAQSRRKSGYSNARVIEERFCKELGYAEHREGARASPSGYPWKAFRTVSTRIA
jgi:hypothetical protein